jgi:two-component system phosphate regulon sensor histidine kinase PhoR
MNVSGPWVPLFGALLLALLVWRWLRRQRQLGDLLNDLRRNQLSPIPDESPELSEIRSAVRMAMERSQTSEQQRAEAAETLVSVFDTMSQGVWMTDANGIIRRHNQAVAQLFPGRALLNELPRSVLRSVPLELAISAACDRGESQTLQISIDQPVPRDLVIHVAPLGKNLRGAAAVFEDVTELRRLEKVRQDFVANVSHELRTPIAAILGYAETLKSGALEDPQHAPKMVDIIHRQAWRLSTLVDDLLELSTLDSKQRVLHPSLLPLDELRPRVLEALLPRAQAKQIELQWPEYGLTLHADPKALEQVLLNLLDNALKYTPAQGQVWVAAEQRGDQVAIQVTDSGPGIDTAHLGRIFERFYRVDKGRSRETGGTGLGLSIVKHLVVAQGGDVQVSSQSGKGSTFTVLLPVNAPSLAQV